MVHLNLKNEKCTLFFLFLCFVDMNTYLEAEWKSTSCSSAVLNDAFRMSECERGFWAELAVHHSLANGTLRSWRVLSSISSITALLSLYRGLWVDSDTRLCLEDYSPVCNCEVLYFLIINFGKTPENLPSVKSISFFFDIDDKKEK